MSVEKIGPQHRAPQGGRSACPPVISSSGAAQSREPGAAVRHARSSPQLGWSQSRGNRRGPRVFSRRPEPGGAAASGAWSGRVYLVEVGLYGRPGGLPGARNEPRLATTRGDVRWWSAARCSSIRRPFTRHAKATTVALRSGGNPERLQARSLNQRSLAARKQKAPSRRELDGQPRPSVSSKWAAIELGKIPTGAFRRLSSSPSRRRWNWAAYGRPYSGVSGAQAGPPDPDLQRRSSGVGDIPATRPFASSSPTPPMEAPSPLWADRRDRALWRSRSQVRCAGQASARADWLALKPMAPIKVNIKPDRAKAVRRQW